MDEKQIYRISLLTGLIGLIILYLSAEEIKVNQPESLEAVSPSEDITLSGTIKKISFQEQATFLELENEQNQKIEVILFGEEKEIYLQEGDSVEVSGTVEEYQNRKEIIASRVVLR